MKRRNAILLALGLCVGAIAVVPFFINADTFREPLQRKLSERLGRDVQLGELRLSLFGGRVSADRIVIQEDPNFGEQPFLTAESLSIGIQWKPILFDNRLIVEDVEIHSPSLRLLQNDRMAWNISSLGKRPAPEPVAPPAAEPVETEPLDLSIQRLRLSNGSVLLLTAGKGARPVTISGLDGSLEDIAARSAMPLSLKGVLEPKAEFSVVGTLGPLPSETGAGLPLDARYRLTQLDLVASGITPPDARLQGLIDSEGSLSLRDHVLTLVADSQLHRFAIGAGATPADDPIQVTSTLRHHLKVSKGEIEQAAVKLGGATASAKGSYQLGPQAADVHLELSGKGMPLNDLKSYLPAFGVMLPQGATLQNGTLALEGEIQGAADNLSADLAVQLQDSVMAGYSLSKAIQTAARIAAGVKIGNDTPIRVLRMHVARDRQQSRLHGIHLEVSELGLLEGNLTISAAEHLQGTLTANIESSGGLLGQGLSRLTGTTRNTLSMPLQVTGTVQQPIISADTKSLTHRAVKDVVESFAPKAKTLLDKLLKGRDGSQ